MSNKSALLVEVIYDFYRHIGLYILVLLVVLSAFSVIYFTHLNRQATSKFEQLLIQQDELDIEWRNLLIEQNSLAEHSEIASKAKKLLNMKRTDESSEVVVKIE